MDDLPFAPLLIGLQFWQNALDSTYKSLQTLKPSSEQRGSLSALSPVAMGDTWRRELLTCQEQTDRSLSVARGMVDNFRRGMFETMLAVVPATSAGADTEAAAARSTRPADTARKAAA
ncbi:MAG: hypothetical protein WA840_16015 [Caulobacteraceae bacterium]